MKTSIDISFYPLNKDFRAPIKKFIAALKEDTNITVKSNSMSTQVYGDYDAVMSTVTKCMKEAFELPESIFVLKIINMDRDK